MFALKYYVIVLNEGAIIKKKGKWVFFHYIPDCAWNQICTL